jgi:hypothetical protein
LVKQTTSSSSNKARISEKVRMSSLVKSKRPDYIYIGDIVKEEPELKASMILDIEKDIVIPIKPKERRARAKTVLRERDQP